MYKYIVFHLVYLWKKFNIYKVTQEIEFKINISSKKTLSFFIFSKNLLKN